MKVVQKIKRHILCPVTFICEIMCGGARQAIDNVRMPFACWIRIPSARAHTHTRTHAHTHTHTQQTLRICNTHCKIGCAYAPQCYVVGTLLPVLFHYYSHSIPFSSVLFACTVGVFLFPILQRHVGSAKLDIPTSKMSCLYNTHCWNTCIARLETETFAFSQITADNSNLDSQGRLPTLVTMAVNLPISGSFLIESVKIVQFTVVMFQQALSALNPNTSQTERHTEVFLCQTNCRHRKKLELRLCVCGEICHGKNSVQRTNQCGAELSQQLHQCPHWADTYRGKERCNWGLCSHIWWCVAR
jgi:hypothetical protein